MFVTYKNPRLKIPTREAFVRVLIFKVQIMGMGSTAKKYISKDVDSYVAISTSSYIGMRDWTYSC
jgi:hypothetical protein